MLVSLLSIIVIILISVMVLVVRSLIAIIATILVVTTIAIARTNPVASVINVFDSTVPIDLIEIVLVDDGSKDRTGVEAKAAGAKVIVQKRNQGQGAALRRGIKAAVTSGAIAVVTYDACLLYTSDAADE